MWDVVIVGAGPAGLNAALILGRCRRRVLICDQGQPRNAAATHLHGFLSRDNTPPLELLRLGRDQLAPYETVEFRTIEVSDVRKLPDSSFSVTLADSVEVNCRLLLLATGVRDQLPPLDGLAALYGKSVHHCPYCDAWEWRDRSLAAYGQGDTGVGLAVTLSQWSRDIVLCTDGPARLSRLHARKLRRRNIPVNDSQIRRLEGDHGMLRQIIFESGESLARDALFVKTYQVQTSSLAARLGCEDTRRRSINKGKYEATKVPGLFVAGDASRDVQWAIVAAAEGAQAAYAMNKSLLKQLVRTEASD